MNKALFTSNSDEWYTPLTLFNQLNERFHFTLDPCCTKETAKASNYYTILDDGLTKNWNGNIVFCNPPYSDIKRWVKKCYDEWNENTTIVLLIPARTDTSYFHDFIYHKAEIEFIRGRLHFSDSKNGAPFPSMLCVFNKGAKQ